MKSPVISLGRYFGYPDCCIKEHISRLIKYTKGEKFTIEKRKLDGTGYLPCKKCNKKTEFELLERIKQNRECSKPFPNDNLTEVEIIAICDRELK